MNVHHVFCATLLTAIVSCPAAEEPLSRIAFGSCANESRPQPIWEAINKLKPQLFIFTGDNVYADTADPEKLKASYDGLAAITGFAELRENTPILATWDDHDYGKNDAGAEFAGKHASKKAFMDFFDTPANSPLRQRGGIYDAKIYGPEGQRVQVILLDTRWFRSPLMKMDKAELKALRRETGKKLGPYLPDTSTGPTMLGDAQWRWLKGQLRKPAELRLIVSSIQFVPDDHTWEKWGNLPRERRRMLQIIRDTDARGVVFLSGDRHFAEISELPHSGYPILEITSSGLNQKGLSSEPNRFRVPKSKSKPYPKSNFGMVLIDWSQADPPVTLQIKSESGRAVRQLQTKLSALGVPAKGARKIEP